MIEWFVALQIGLALAIASTLLVFGLAKRKPINVRRARRDLPASTAAHRPSAMHLGAPNRAASHAQTGLGP